MCFRSKLSSLEPSSVGVPFMYGKTAGTGQADFSGDGGQATAAKFDYPISAYYDNRTGDVYIADQGNHRIRKVAPDGIVTRSDKYMVLVKTNVGKIKPLPVRGVMTN